jgi:hypothetical protein
MKPILILQTPRSDFNYRYVVPTGEALRETQVNDRFAAIMPDFEDEDATYRQGNEHMAARRRVQQTRSTRIGDEVLALVGINPTRLTPEQQTAIAEALQNRLAHEVDTLVREGISWQHEGKQLLVERPELAQWYEQSIAPHLQNAPNNAFVNRFPEPPPTGDAEKSKAADSKHASRGGGTPWLRIAAAVLVVIGIGGLAAYTLFWGDGTQSTVGADRPDTAQPAPANADDPWADYRQHLEARYGPEQAQETMVALCEAAKDQKIHAQNCKIDSTADELELIGTKLNDEPWFPGWVDCVTGSRDEEALATFFKLTDELGPQLVPALGETRETGDEVRTQCGEDITGKVVEVREALYKMVDQLQNDGTEAEKFVTYVFGENSAYNGSDEGVEAVVEAIVAKKPTTQLALLTSQDEETAETLYGLFNRNDICGDAPGCESLGEILAKPLTEELQDEAAWDESDLGKALLHLKTSTEALPDPVSNKTIAQ